MAKSESTKIEFGYFHDYESEQFAFYRIPKVLFTDEYFRNLSSDAKVLYGLMLDRMALSIRNNWVDNEGKVYIIFTLEQVMEYMNCGKDKGVKILAELDTDKGIGLIERVKNSYKVGKQSYKELKSQGFGLSNIEITDGNIKSFERVAKKYRLDFALKKDSSTKPPTYYVFFKGQDTEMMNLAFKKYLGVQMNKKDKPSIMKKLMHFKDAVSKGKNRERAREQQKDRGQSL